ncbi:ead/Ea22-like family protein [Escherichia coli]|nr:ead/Ea22-like family protein [Escherichia coli]
MSKIDYQALRAKAEKATCGVWSLEYGEGRFDGDDALIHREVAGYLPICRIEGSHPESGFDEDFQMEQQANAEFIAAANPATVLALLDELERNQQYIKRRDQENEDIALTVGKLRVELEAAEKRIAELESLTVPQLPQQAVPDEMPEPDTARMFFTDAVVAIAKVQVWNACRAAMLHSAEPVSNSDELPLDYLQGHKDGLEWAAQLAEANHPQTGDWLYDDPIDLARAIRKGPDMPTVQGGNSPVTPDGWISCSERMPEMGERQCYVLAADFKNNYQPNIPNTQVGVYVDWFNDGNPTWDDGDGEDLYLKEVTHWMPLPEPPQEVNRG